MTPERGTSSVQLRRPVSADRSAMDTLIASEMAATPYHDVPRYFLRLALDGQTSESRGIVAERDGAVVGFVLYGEVAGAVGAGRIHYVAVSASDRRIALGPRLCEAAISDLVTAGARLVIAELPDDPLVMRGRALLTRLGFGEAARVDDYYRDGMALTILARPVGEHAGHGRAVVTGPTDP